MNVKAVRRKKGASHNPSYPFVAVEEWLILRNRAQKRSCFLKEMRIEFLTEHRRLRQSYGRLEKLRARELPARSNVLGIQLEHVIDIEEEHLGAR